MGEYRVENRASRRAKAKKAAKVGAIAATAVAVGFATPMANAALTQPYVIGSLDADPDAIAESDYATFGNLMVVADNLGRIQGAVTNPIAALTPTGWLPTSTNNYQGPTTVPLTYVNGLARAAAMTLAQPNTSGVPGIPALGSVATLVPQIAQGLPLVTIGADGLVAVAKTGLAIAGLSVVNGVITVHNAVPAVPGFYEPFADSPLVTGIPSLDAAIPGATETTSSWVNNFSWPVLQTTGSTWMTSDRLVLPNVTTEDIEDNFDLTVPGPLQHGKPVFALVNHQGQEPVYRYDLPATSGTRCTLGAFLCSKVPGITLIGSVYYYVAPAPQRPCDLGALACSLVPGIIKFDTGETTTVDHWVYEQTGTETITDYVPQDGVDQALGLLDGINVPGFSITKQEAGGNYGFFGGGAAGWLLASTTIVIPAHGDTPAQVSVVPTAALGFAAPFGLLTAGALYTPGVVTQSGQSTNSTLGSRSFSLGIPALGVGIETTSLFESAHIGPDGIAFNSGWTVALINGGPVPIPLVYSLGSFNIGPKGIGYTSPSLFGIGIPDFQLGTNVGTTTTGTSLGGFELPTTLIRLDPKTLFSALNIDDPTGLGLTDPFGTAQKTLDPLFEKYVTPLATPLWQAGADLADQVTNTWSSEQVKLSDKLADITDRAADRTEQLAVEVAGLDQKLTGGQLKELSDQLKEAEGGALVKQSAKLQKSLQGTQERAKKVTDQLRQGNVRGAVKQVGENVKNRVDRLKKDLKNGVKKLRGADN